MVGVLIDFLERFAYQSPDPDANIGGQTMHQTEARDGFVFVDVELQSESIISQLYAKPNWMKLTLADTKIKYLWKKTKMA